MSERLRFTRHPDMMGGRYCINSERMPVVQIKSMVADVGREWVPREFPSLTNEKIDFALTFRAGKGDQ